MKKQNRNINQEGTFDEKKLQEDESKAEDVLTVAECKADEEKENAAEDALDEKSAENAQEITELDSLKERLKALEEENAYLKQAAEQETKEEEEVREFLQRFPLAQDFTEELCSCLEEHSELCGTEGLTTALLTVLCKNYKNPKELAHDEEFLRSYIFNNERVSQAILEEYLNSVSTQSQAVCVKRGCLPKTEKEKPTTIFSAGEMAKALFRK